jgi:putative transposase
METRKPYRTDLTDEQWALVKDFFPADTPDARCGRPREVPWREILNALFYQARTGCAWEMLPHDLPNNRTVYFYFRRWRDDGTLEKIHDALREKVRQQAGKESTPSAAIIDSQSVKTTEKGGSAAMTRARRPRVVSVTSS